MKLVIKKQLIISLIIILYVSSGILYSQTKVYIPDTKFCNFLNSEYPFLIDASGDSLIVSQAATITGSLYCDYKEIEDLTGVEYFINITELSCESNKLSSLPDLSALTSLQILNCKGNQLTELPDLSANTMLTELYCDRNKLSALPNLSVNTLLIKLHCSNNVLTSLPDLSNNTVIEELVCFFNQIENLPDLSANTALKSLRCSDNLLTDIPDLSNNTMLTYLNIHANSLTNFPDISNNTLLEIINCGLNDFDSIPDLSTLIQLEELLINSIQLQEIPDLSANINLKILRCDDNRLSTLPDLSSNTALTKLWCSANELKSLPDLSNNTALATLYCQDNELESLPDLSSDTSLVDLNCRNNLLTDLPDLSDNFRLKNLSCSANMLTSLPDFSISGSLQKVIVSYNKLDFSDAKALRQIDTISGISSYTYTPQNPFGNADTLRFCHGDSISLSISSQDSALSYQWYKNDTPVIDATDTVLVIKNATVADAGTYTCKSTGVALNTSNMIWGPGINEFVSEAIEVEMKESVNLYCEDTSFCLDDTPITLTGYPSGGIYSGNGIFNDSIFYPDNAGVGSHDIHYNYTDDNYCNSEVIKIFTVKDCVSESIEFIDYMNKIEIFPNPCNGSVNININAPDYKNLSYSIYNSVGIKLISKNLTLYNGSFSDELDLNIYGKGIFYMKFEDNTNSIIRKIVVD